MARTSASVIGVVVAACIALSGCAAPTENASGRDEYVVIDAEELGSFNPLLGHGDSGESKIYESLYRVQEGVADRIPDAVPVLADGAPSSSTDATVWTVDLKPGVTFSDGSAFGPEDVIATYSAVVDPAFAAPISADYGFIEKVERSGALQVRFTLAEPFSDFGHRLFLAIAPSEAFATPTLSEASPLNEHPIGTGPYTVSEFRPDQVVLTARDDYWGSPKPTVKRFVLRYTADDNARAQQVRGGADGTVLPPALAEATATDGYRVASAVTGDWRGITLPSGNPVAGDPAVRMALNLGVDRQSMVDDVLLGQGRPTSSLLGAFYGDAYDPAQDFPFDPAQAGRVLDDAGWKVGADGIRSRAGRRAAFDIAYYPTEVVRRDLTLAAVSDARRIGIDITPVATDKKSMTAEYLAGTPFMVGGGAAPYTVDGQIYAEFHSKYAAPGSGSKWDNTSDYVNPRVDQLLDQARAERDATRRNQLYREFGSAYRAAPAMLALVYVNHVYTYRDKGYEVLPTALEPHAHGAGWGPWYSLARWTR